MAIEPPRTLEDVEQLIHRLYGHSEAGEVRVQIQEVLQRFQKSPEGWQLSQALMGRPGDNIKVFGVLTIIVKLNTETLSEEIALSVLQNLTSWLLNSLHDGSSTYVVKKFCSALVTHFRHYGLIWPECIRHLVRCLYTDQSLAPSQSLGPGEACPSMLEMVQSLSPEKSRASIWFTMILAEEAEKMLQFDTPHNLAILDCVVRNVQDARSLMGHFLTRSSDPTNFPCQQAAIKCLQPWIVYGLKAAKRPVITDLQTLVRPIIESLVDETLYEPAIQLLTDILEDWDHFFTPDHINTLYAYFGTPWAQQKYQELCQGNFDTDFVKFGMFLLAFANSQQGQLMDMADDRAREFLGGLTNLLKIQCPFEDDGIFVQALEFWGQFVESLSMEYPSKSFEWDQPPLLQIRDALSSVWRKLQFPEPDVFNSWDSADRTAFTEARKDLADLLQYVHTMAGRPLVYLFADSILLALEKADWAEVEAATFCLGALSDCISEKDTNDDILTRVFASPLFDLLRRTESPLPSRVRRTCLLLVERYSDYFGRNEIHLESALSLLLAAVEDPHLAPSASKSIYKLCSSSRQHFTSQVGAFIEHYSCLRNSQKLESFPEERIVGAIACIIQAVQDPVAKVDSFRRILLLINMDIDTCMQLRSCVPGTILSTDNTVLARAYDRADFPEEPVTSIEVSVLVAIRALRCLCSIAKGLQAPTEFAEDLESSDEAAVSSSFTDISQMHIDIMGILAQLKDKFSAQSEVVEVLCSILRAGFSETEPGPFVFPPEMVTAFITSTWHSRIPAVVNTASAFLSSLHYGKHKPFVSQALVQLLPWVLGLLDQLPSLDDDPELTQSCIELVQKAMIRRPDIFMSQSSDSLEFIFTLAINLLDGNEPLPKAAAAEFWAAFIPLKANDQTTQAAIDNAMVQLGPAISRSLVQNIGGQAARSQLDKLSDPFKRLVVQHVNSRHWLEAALHDPSFPSGKATAADKSTFLRKVVSLRGQRGTNQVVKEFWALNRGIETYH